MGRGLYVPNSGGYLLISAAAATTTVPTKAYQGQLYEAMGFKQYTFQVKGITSATVSIYATLDPIAGEWAQGGKTPTGTNSPAVTWTVLDAITADGFYEVNGPFVAITAAVTVYSSGTISAWAFACP